jgi:IS30 family transposase
MPRKPSHHGSAWTKSDDRKLFALHGRGATGAEIARALGRTRSSVYQRLTMQRPRPRRSGR